MPKDFSHFKGKDLTRSEKIQRKLTEIILQSKVADEDRESSLIWELRHSAGVCQIGRILAQKRELDIEMTEILCILHDIYAIITGKYKDHAMLGAKIARKMLKKSNDFTSSEIELITKAIAQHSDKHIYTTKPYVELIKDADVFDCSLYEKSKTWYKLHKPKEFFEETIKRIKKVRKELGLPKLPILRQ